MMKRFLDYDDLVFLGESNHALYFRARPPARLGVAAEHVALKVLVRDASDAQWRAVAREIELLRSLESPYIVDIHDIGHDAGRLFYSREFATLGTLAFPERPLGPGVALVALRHAVLGLAQLHDIGVVHRDVRPAKVLLYENGGKLNDLGISDDLGERTGDPIPTGTIGFMAPEVARGEHATVASDLFGVGATLHRVLTGRSVYALRADIDLLDAVRHVAVQPPVIHDAELAAPWRDLLRDCLADDPARRPASAHVIADRIAEALAARAADEPADQPSQQSA